MNLGQSKNLADVHKAAVTPQLTEMQRQQAELITAVTKHSVDPKLIGVLIKPCRSKAENLVSEKLPYYIRAHQIAVTKEHIGESRLAKDYDERNLNTSQVRQDKISQVDDMLMVSVRLDREGFVKEVSCKLVETLLGPERSKELSRIAERESDDRKLSGSSKAESAAAKYLDMAWKDILTGAGTMRIDDATMRVLYEVAEHAIAEPDPIAVAVARGIAMRLTVEQAMQLMERAVASA